MKVKPISPSEVPKIHADSIPDEVIEAFNELIAENWSPTTKSAGFKQDSVVSRILDKFDHSITGKSGRDSMRSEIFKKHYLDVEDLYREQGWIVEYDKPGYNESYSASFKFKIKNS